MSRRRTHTVRIRCGHSDPTSCQEFAIFEASTRADAARLDARYGRDGWRCTRHSGDPGEVLSLTNRSRTLVLVACPDERAPGLYWREVGKEADGGSGFAHGPGWKAWANEFPAGTRIVLRVDVEPPA